MKRWNKIAYLLYICVLTSILSGIYHLKGTHRGTKQIGTMRKAPDAIDTEKLSESTEILRALAHPLRMQILKFIDENDHINVNKIYNTLNLEQSITSQHLRILRLAGIVNTNRDGKFIHYSIDYNKISKAVNAVGNFYAEDVDA